MPSTPRPARMAARPRARRRRRGRHAQLPRKTLASRCGRCTGAADAEAGDELIRHHRFDLLVLDITPRQERHRLAARAARAGLRRRGDPHHRLRRPRHRHRGAARRRERLHPQALPPHADPQRGAAWLERAGSARELGAAPRTAPAHAGGRRAGRQLDRHQGPAGGAAARRRGRQHGAAGRRIGHRQGTRRARHPPPERAPRRPLRAGELRDHVARPSSRSCSATRAAPRRAAARGATGCSSTRRAARSSSTRSATCRCRCRPRCCACWKTGASARWAASS